MYFKTDCIAYTVGKDYQVTIKTIGIKSYEQPVKCDHCNLTHMEQRSYLYVNMTMNDGDQIMARLHDDGDLTQIHNLFKAVGLIDGSSINHLITLIQDSDEPIKIFIRMMDDDRLEIEP